MDFIENKSTIYTNNSLWRSIKYGEFRILGLVSRNNFLCEFLDRNNTKVLASKKYIKNGILRNPNHRTLHGVGYMGQGKYKSRTNGKINKEYTAWSAMISRCYYRVEEFNPSYTNVTVCERWHSFQNFCEDIENLEGYKNWKNNKEYELDKDMMCSKLNMTSKIYSPKTCAFIKRSLNNSKEYKHLNLTGLLYIAHRVKDGYEEEFKNQSEFARKYELTTSNISKCIKDGGLHKGWKFSVKRD